MKIAIPVKTNKEDTVLAPLFGKAKWFALIEDGQISIEQNLADGGQAVVECLAQKGIDTIIIQEMGMNPYRKVQFYGNIKLYHAGFKRVLLIDALKQFEAGALTLLDDEGMARVIAHHETKHPAHDEHSHSHGHHH